MSSPRCRSELIASAVVAIVPGQKCIKKSTITFVILCDTTREFQSMLPLNENDCMPYCFDFVRDILSILPDLSALFIYYYLL